MLGLLLPRLDNFRREYVDKKGYQYRSPHWRCMLCDTPGVTDRVQHNLKGCRPIAWLDPIGVMVETVFALWGPDAPVSVRRIIPEIPAGKSIKIKELPYFTKDPVSDTWMVIGFEEFMDPGHTVVVNRREDEPQEVVIDEWMYQKESPKTGNRYVMATFERPWEE